jgi:hypothetical protein
MNQKLTTETTKINILLKPTTNIITNNIRNKELLASAACAAILTPKTREAVN